MTKMDAMKRMEQLEERKFIIWMVDRWTVEDRLMLDEIEREMRELRERLLRLVRLENTPEGRNVSLFQ